MTPLPLPNDFPTAIIGAGPAACAAWKEFVAGEGLRPSTCKLYRNRARQFLTWLEQQDIGLALVSPRLVERFLDEKDLSYDSKITYRTALCRFLNALVAHQVVPSNSADQAELSVRWSEAVAEPPTRAERNDAVGAGAALPALGQAPEILGSPSPTLDSIKRRQEWLKCEIARERVRQQLHARDSERHGKNADNLAIRLDEVTRFLESLAGDDASPDSEPTPGGKERCSSGPAGSGTADQQTLTLHTAEETP